MLTRIRNANLALHDDVVMPTSNVRREIARILLEEGYITEWREESAAPVGKLVITLKYGQGRERPCRDEVMASEAFGPALGPRVDDIRVHEAELLDDAGEERGLATDAFDEAHLRIR